MHFPKSLVALMAKKLGEGAQHNELTTSLIGDYGFTAPVAEKLMQAIVADTATMQLPAVGERPDVARDAHGMALRQVQTLPDWSAQVFVEMLAPQIIVFRRFLPDSLLERITQQVEDSATPFANYLSQKEAGFSHDMLLKREGATLDCLDAAARALNWPANRWGLPIVRDTLEGQELGFHYDAFSPSNENDKKFLEYFGNNHRIGTLIVYLRPAIAGGSTYFANLGLRVALNAGDAVFFGYSKDNLRQSGLLHCGERVTDGSKRLMTLFCYERELVRTKSARTPG